MKVNVEVMNNSLIDKEMIADIPEVIAISIQNALISKIPESPSSNTLDIIDYHYNWKGKFLKVRYINELRSDYNANYVICVSVLEKKDYLPIVKLEILSNEKELYLSIKKIKDATAAKLDQKVGIIDKIKSIPFTDNERNIFMCLLNAYITDGQLSFIKLLPPRSTRMIIDKAQDDPALS